MGPLHDAKARVEAAALERQARQRSAGMYAVSEGSELQLLRLHVRMLHEPDEAAVSRALLGRRDDERRVAWPSLAVELREHAGRC